MPITCYLASSLLLPTTFFPIGVPATLIPLRLYSSAQATRLLCSRKVLGYQCSPHPKKQAPGLAVDNRDDLGCKQRPSTSSSTYHLDAELVQVGHEEVKSIKSVPIHSSTDQLELRDPLEEHRQQPIDLICYGAVAIKSEPLSDNEDDYYNTESTEDNFLPTTLMCIIPTSNLRSTLPNGDNTSSRNEAFPNQSSIKPNTTSPTTMNHRKRRLLASDHGARGESNTGAAGERRIPKLQPLTPLKVYLAEFVSLARSKGLLTLTAKDDSGNEWVEIREAVASYRVPKYGYPTHLSRLIVDSSLQYYVEVLGLCVREGSLLCEDASNNLNYTEIGTLFRAFCGGHTICSGIDAVSDWVSDFHMRAIQELGNAESKFATQPDQRYRSVDCSLWIDRRLGPSCPACKAAKLRDVPEFTGDYPASPMDLRRTSSRSHHV